MCGRLVNLDTVARVLADYYHLKTETQLAALDEALSKVPAVSVGGGHGKDHAADPNKMVEDLISRRAVIDEIEYELEMINSALDSITLDFNARERLRQRRGEAREILNSIQQLPPVQPPKEIPKRVLWTGWKGCRDTRYKCPNCEKPVRNDDAYCHRCGQRLMFPHISFSDYVPGEKQDVIVRWDDEG